MQSFRNGVGQINSSSNQEHVDLDVAIMSVDKFCHLPRKNLMDKKICRFPRSKIGGYDIQIKLLFDFGAEEGIFWKIFMENTVSDEKSNFELGHFVEQIWLNAYYSVLTD